MTYTIYLLFGLLLGFSLGLIAGFGLSKSIVDETIKKAWLELIINAPKVKADKKDAEK